jgi:hypothetical protein
MYNRHTPFAWGQKDCALFVCDAVLEMSGVDLGLAARGQYTTEEGATSFLSTATGGGGLVEYADLIAEQHGLEVVPLRLAGRGDVVLWEHPQLGPALGIVGLDAIYAVFAGPTGIYRHRVLACQKAWRVG